MNTIPPLISGLGELESRYDHFILDVWGVLHNGHAAYPGVREALLWLQDAGKQVILLSNSPNRSSRVIEKVLEPMGITSGMYNHILTSGEAAYHHMREHHDGARVYTFWDEEIPTAIENLNMTRVYDVDDADFIYGSLMPHGVTGDDYAPVLQRALARNLPLICGNPDRVVAHGDALHVCVGALAEVYEAMDGPVVWIGKPYRPVYEQAWETLGTPDQSKIIAVGDGLVTDVAGAHNFGCDVVWNLVGIHWDEVQENGTLSPARTGAVLQNHPAPTYLMHGFKR